MTQIGCEMIWITSEIALNSSSEFADTSTVGTSDMNWKCIEVAGEDI